MPKTECINNTCAGYSFLSDGNCIRFREVEECPRVIYFPEKVQLSEKIKECSFCKSSRLQNGEGKSCFVYRYDHHLYPVQCNDYGCFESVEKSHKKRAEVEKCDICKFSIENNQVDMLCPDYRKFYSLTPILCDHYECFESVLLTVPYEKSCKNCGRNQDGYCVRLFEVKCNQDTFISWIPKTATPTKQEETNLIEIIKDLIEIIKSQQGLIQRLKN